MKEPVKSEYSFLGLSNHGKPLELLTTLSYLVALVDSKDHEIIKPDVAVKILPWVFDAEEQLESGEALLSWQNECLPPGYYPQTPCMLVEKWSPISAVIDQGLSPLALDRERSSRAVATGIWEPNFVSHTKSVEKCRTDEELFWSIFALACQRAKDRKLLLSIIAKPGWDYETDRRALEKWGKHEIAKADRILWKRTAR